jgi:hypothetical protein
MKIFFFLSLFAIFIFAIDINDCNELLSLVPLDFSGSYKLVNDIDCVNITSFTPIGSASFTGIFDGNGKVIRNVNINSDLSGYSGIFYSGNGCNVSDLILENITISLYITSGVSALRVGALFANSINCVFSNIEIYGSLLDVEIQTTRTLNLGALFGYNSNDKIENCKSYNNRLLASSLSK